MKLEYPRNFHNIWEFFIQSKYPQTKQIILTNSSIEETVGREIFRFAQHPPHTRFDAMGGFFDQYKELLGTL